ncbi:MAG: Na+/H+ antiporter NhaA [Bacteroidales bacterium]
MQKVPIAPMKTIQNAFNRFLAMESSSSILLIGSAILAIFLANSALSETYFGFLETKFSISLGEFSLSKTIIHWINDGLMVIFFFVIGLEIKRELMAGELQSIKKSALPIIAAVGGMVVPVVIFLAVNPGGESAKGWGIPMATDIAFSLGILQLLGKRVPVSLKIFLTAFAIIDDLGAVLIIAFFYSSQIIWKYILISMAIYSILIVITILRLNLRYFYLFCGIIIWYLFLKAGIHPTIAGVLMALVTPVTRKIGKLTFSKSMREVVNDFENTKTPGIFLNYRQIEAIGRAETLVQNIQPYLQSLEHRLHAWVAYLIMPVFALANAGVKFNFQASGGINPLALHIGLALLAGKVIGISAFSYLGVRLKLVNLPDNTEFKHIIGISFLGAVGFTMALFINSLAYTDEVLINSAKLGIIIASVIAGIIGYFLLKRWLKPSSLN